MKIKEQGAVLIFTILILSGLSFLIWRQISLNTISQLRASFSYHKLQSLYYAKASLNDSLKRLKTDPNSCFIKNTINFLNGSGYSLIENEDGKINLNFLVNSEGVINYHLEQLLKNIFTSLHLSPVFLNSLADWIDEDNISRKNGAEQVYYSSKNIRCKNSQLDSLGELFLIKDYSQQLPKLEIKTLTPYLTLHSQGKININTAPLLILQAISPKISTKIAERIIKHRRTNGYFLQVEDLLVIPGIEPSLLSQIKPLITTESNYFSICATGTYKKTESLIQVIIHLDRDLNQKILYYSET